ncbi:AUGMIN subunit 8 isoform X2 [Manihot esculenta]|uniref:Uncharacterized protein n=2 Tax=Manihot esculenta TaxID=3983 RepID=A0ACB7HHA7_MANES|nr:AUGMIN subunit 8 isoform X2 [Manihot esculenta]KAG8651849.1 hypothetical protein MANES_06G031100v8 [Manihot esculenta]KAG8651852.1 hypothetical protein MANES_06G031100v8 [Manihot esculenta]
MDVCESRKDKAVEKPRHPLVPAEGNNNAAATSHHPQTMEISSKYKSPTPFVSRRCTSPSLSRTLPTTSEVVAKRANSVERMRPPTPSSPASPFTPVHDSSVDMLQLPRRLSTGSRLPESLWPSTMRSVGVSCRSDSISIPVSKKENPVSNISSDRTLQPSSNVAQKQAEPPVGSCKPTSERKRSPFKGKNVQDQSENIKPIDGLRTKLIDQHRWPSRSGGKVSSNALNKSVDLNDKTPKALSIPVGNGFTSLRGMSLPSGSIQPIPKSINDAAKLSSLEDIGRIQPGENCADDSSLQASRAQKLMETNLSDKLSLIIPTVRLHPLPTHGSCPPSPSWTSVSRGVSPSRAKPSTPRPSTPPSRGLEDIDRIQSGENYVDDSSLQVSEAHKVTTTNLSDGLSLMIPAVRSHPLSIHGSCPPSPSWTSISKGVRPSTPFRGLEDIGRIQSRANSVDDSLMQVSEEHKATTTNLPNRLSLTIPAVRSHPLSTHGSCPPSPSWTVVSRGVSPSRARQSTPRLSTPPSGGLEDIGRIQSGANSADDNSLQVSGAHKVAITNLSNRLSVIIPAIKSHPLSTLGSCPPSPSRNPISRSVSPFRAKPSTPRPSAPPSKGVNPTLTWPSSISSPPNSSPVLSFIVDFKKEGKGSSHIEDAHQIRLLYNRYLQWQFANARAEAVLHVQKVNSKKMLFNVWTSTLDLWDSVIRKRINLQQLKLELKLNTILNDQIACLDDWASLERDHLNSLSGALKDLLATALRLPMIRRAKANINSLKPAICSAVDVLQAMESSICSLLSRSLYKLQIGVADNYLHFSCSFLEAQLFFLLLWPRWRR